MKTTLTRKWKHNRFEHHAAFGCIHLQCVNMSHWYDDEERWAGIASLGNGEKRTGKNRKSTQAARQDAEILAIELLRDIRDGTKALLASYDMGDDD